MNDKVELLLKILQQRHLSDTVHIAISWIFEHKKEFPPNSGRKDLVISEQKLLILLTYSFLIAPDIFHGLSRIKSNYTIPKDLADNFEKSLEISKKIKKELKYVRDKAAAHRAANIAEAITTNNISFGISGLGDDISVNFGNHDVRELDKDIINLIKSLDEMCLKLHS